ncbi:MAG: flippase-like domain-containing protein [Candidatus Desulfofervidus auxilii]|nr:flippase-like domain-containing protein [Candidatus Desulfofervidus auxilii]
MFLISQKFKFFLSFFLTIGILWALIKFIGLHNLFVTFKKIKIKYALMAFFLSLSFPFFGALRWHWLLKAINQNLSILNCFALTIGTWPLNVFLPSRTGDFFRVVFLNRNISKAKVFGSIIAEKLLDIACLSIIGLFGSIFIKNKKFTIIFIGILILITVSIQVLFFLEKWLRDKNIQLLNKLNLAIQGMNILSLYPKFSIIAAFWSLINWSLSIVQVFLFFKAFDIYVSLIEISARLPLSIFIGILPITLAGIGTRDTAMLFLFKEFAPLSIIFSVSIFYTLYSYFLYGLLGIPFFIYLSSQCKS